MEVLDLQAELNNLRSRGVSLNLDEKMQLEIALHKLHQEINAEEVLFWGKIQGKFISFLNLRHRHQK